MIDYNPSLKIISKVTTKNQVTIPKQVREMLDIHSHDQIIFQTDDNGRIILKKKEPKNDLWEKVEEHYQKYGPIDDDEVEWGEDIEIEGIDE